MSSRVLASSCMCLYLLCSKYMMCQCILMQRRISNIFSFQCPSIFSSSLQYQENAVATGPCLRCLSNLVAVYQLLLDGGTGWLLALSWWWSVDFAGNINHIAASRQRMCQQLTCWSESWMKVRTKTQCKPLMRSLKEVVVKCLCLLQISVISTLICDLFLLFSSRSIYVVISSRIQ